MKEDKMDSAETMDRLETVGFYIKAQQLWDDFWEDSEIIGKDYRGREIVKQLTRSVGSIAANIEEGYGRGFGKEYPQFLRIARGSARETKGWYQRAKRLLAEAVLAKRVSTLNQIIGAISKAIRTLESRKRYTG
jgi:four helix bundle protein